MSSQHQYLNADFEQNKFGEIDHVELLGQNLSNLCCSDNYSDVILVVEGEKIPSHKVILASRSEFFRALLFGGLKESSQEEIVLKEVPIKAFRELLKYIYTGHLFLQTLNHGTILDILGLAHEFGFIELEISISDYLQKILNIRNVCFVLDASRLYGLSRLTEICQTFMDRHAKYILEDDSIMQLSSESLHEVLLRNSFYAPEIDIFRMVMRWCANNPEKNAEELISCVRLSLIKLKDLLTLVRPIGIVKPEKLLDAIEEKVNVPDVSLPHRGMLVLDENVSTTTLHAKVLQGEMRSALLDGDTRTYDMEMGYTRHAITDAEDQFIVVKLGCRYIVNHIKMLLWDRDTRAYSYYIEVSLDQESWEKVIDYRRYLCRSWQYLYFPSRAVQYIKIVGTNNTVNKVFHLVSFEIMHSSSVPELQNDLVVPIKNIATSEFSATVVEGVSRNRDALLNGDTSHYDWDSGYTCHQLGSGAILVQLGQPYIIGSIRLLLWDCDDRSYSYYVETSVNYVDWEIVADKRKEPCRSWQLLTFNPHPVVYIRILGTHNTANEVFHCVHLECPAQNLLTSAYVFNDRSGDEQQSSRPPLAETAQEAEEAAANNNNDSVDLVYE
ncbi:BTB/POZ domain-containing protein 9 isoform X2 [Ctenocephalides felis]|uniref:BTB/POZ domain-containing protein 9 isoform X2 n=1 Tax=Ctenocephalides felis TaxID=7515 RepID=UPI000E6E16D0|nr:BTB/POZ domain-containing protein 9 isoform X2 [Ctenocephalides felis]